MPSGGAVHRSRAKVLVLAAGLVFATLAVFSAPIAGTALVVSRPIEDPDAIVSLASHEWERLPAAVRLARRFPRASVILTLPVPATKFNCHDCENRLERLQHAGIDRARVKVLPLRRGGTFGEALMVREWAQSTGQRRLIVVTSPYHTRRALATFSTVLSPLGVTVGVEPAADSPAQPDRWWSAPYDRAYVRYEWAARLYYAIRFRVLDP